MNRDDALKLCRMARAICPQQAMDEFTPDVWALVLEDDRYEDAAQALKELSREQPFVHVSEIVKRIKRIRRDRVLDFGTLPDPPADLDPSDQRAYSTWLARTTREIADGRLTSAGVRLPSGPVRDVASLGSVRTVDEALGSDA